MGYHSNEHSVVKRKKTMYICTEVSDLHYLVVKLIHNDVNGLIYVQEMKTKNLCNTSTKENH